MKLRRRAVLKWTGASLCALIVAAWFASGWFIVGIKHRRGNVLNRASVCNGCVMLVRMERPAQFDPSSPWIRTPEGWGSEFGRISQPHGAWKWMPSRTRLRNMLGPLDLVLVPLYIPLAILVIPVTRLFHRDRRPVRWAREGRCARCGYNLSGLPTGGGGACPECGGGTAPRSAT